MKTENSIGKMLLWFRLCSIEFGNRTNGVRLGSITVRLDTLGLKLINSKHIHLIYRREKKSIFSYH